jgi:rubrerythrin
VSGRALAWKLHWYRASELEGALLLGHMLRAAGDADTAHRLVCHAADEARHARLWSEAIHELELPLVRIFRSYQSFYAGHGAVPASLAETLALTHVFEERVHAWFSEEMMDRALPEPVQRTLRVMVRDEEGHLEWVRDWLARVAGSEDLLARFRAVDRTVFESIVACRDRLWTIPGLGEEAKKDELLDNLGKRFG